MNSDKLALRLSLGLTAMMAVILLVEQADLKPWFYPLLVVFNCDCLYQFLRPVCDVITGKDYIRCCGVRGEFRKSYKSDSVTYAFDLGFNVLPLCFYLYTMTAFVGWLVNSSN